MRECRDASVTELVIERTERKRGRHTRANRARARLSVSPLSSQARRVFSDFPEMFGGFFVVFLSEFNGEPLSLADSGGAGFNRLFNNSRGKGGFRGANRNNLGAIISLCLGLV